MSKLLGVIKCNPSFALSLHSEAYNPLQPTDCWFLQQGFCEKQQQQTFQ